MAKVGRSLVTKGNVVQGVCYAKVEPLVQGIAHLAAIPPERIGLNGEYDHYGLAKRIQASFCDGVGRLASAQVSIRQRGSAVILSGQVDTLATLDTLIDIALQAEGSSHVEVQSMQIKDINNVNVKNVVKTISVRVA